MMFSSRTKKGFTLMEMLIVVAIIAILIAIAIPVFSAQLEKSREATCLANRRSLQSVTLSTFMCGRADGSTYADAGAAFSDAFTNDAYAVKNYICPSGGTLSWVRVSDSVGYVQCSRHGGAISGSAAYDALALQIKDRNSAIAQYIKTKIRVNGSLDYPVPQSSLLGGFSAQVVALAKEAGIDLEGGSWRLYQWSSGDISIYYYDGDISAKAVGDTLESVTKWTVKADGTIADSLTSDKITVSSRTVGSGNNTVTYNVIDNATNEDMSK